VFATVVLGGLVIGLVALNASLAQTSFRIGDLDAKLAALTDRNAVLTRRVADRSAPGRIADWAARHGMRLPDEIHFLLVPEHAAGRIDPAGERTRPTGGAP
jgi:cell division protein FtsL